MFTSSKGKERSQSADYPASSTHTAYAMPADSNATTSNSVERLAQRLERATLRLQHEINLPHTVSKLVQIHSLIGAIFARVIQDQAETIRSTAMRASQPSFPAAAHPQWQSRSGTYDFELPQSDAQPYFSGDEDAPLNFWGDNLPTIVVDHTSSPSGGSSLWPDTASSTQGDVPMYAQSPSDSLHLPPTVSGSALGTVDYAQSGGRSLSPISADIQTTMRQPFNCGVCNDRFAARKDLVRHLRCRHSTQRPFQCQYCSHRTARKDNLKRHEKQCKQATVP